MHATSTSIALCLLLVGSLVPLQDSGKKPADPRPVRQSSTTEVERVRRELQGVWQLTRAEIDGANFAAANCSGYLLVAPEYCSLQARLLAPFGSGPDSTVAGFSAGTYRWSYDESRLQLTLTTLLAGSDLENDDAQIDYESPGTRRDYDVTVTSNDLSLVRRNGQTRLFLRRLNRPAPPEPKPTAKDPPKGDR